MGKTLDEMQMEFANSLVDEALILTKKIFLQEIIAEERLKASVNSKNTKGTHVNLLEKEDRKRRNARNMGSKYR